MSYRETIKKNVKGVLGTCIRQTGGSGLYAKIKIDLEHEVQPKGGRRWSSSTSSKAA